MSGVTRHSKESVRLCEHIIKDAFGNVVHRVGSMLLRRGRLALPELARLAGLPPRTAAGALLVLMQHGLVTTSCLYLVHPDPAPDAPRDGLYEFDENECLNRLRYGRILHITQTLARLERYPEAVDIVRRIMLYGRMTVGMIKQQMENVNEALLELVKANLLIPTAPGLSVTYADEVEQSFKTRRVEREGVGETKKILSGPETARVHADAMDRVDSDRRALRNKDRILVEKKIKKDKSVEYTLRKDVPLCINHDRYGVLIRDQIIVDAAASHWNDGAAEVMRAVLAASLAAADASPEAEATLAAPRTDPSVSVTRVQEYINDARVLTRDIRMHRKSKIGDGSGVKTTPEYLMIMAGKDQSGEDTRAYLAVESQGSNPTYYVELQRVSVSLRASLLKAIVADRLGLDARRVLSVVMEAKLASEQTVRDCALLPYKEARKHLSALQAMSLVETQDVPKTTQKTRANQGPAPEFHYWGIDLPRAYSHLLETLYKTMANAHERRTREIASRAGQMAKARVQGRDKLQAKDQADLAAMDGAVRKLDATVLRCGEAMFVLRDLPGWPTK